MQILPAVQILPIVRPIQYGNLCEKVKFESSQASQNREKKKNKSRNFIWNAFLSKVPTTVYFPAYLDHFHSFAWVDGRMGSLSTCLPRLRPRCHLSQKYPWHFHRLSSCNFLIKRVRYMDTLSLPWFSATLDFVASAIKVSPVALCVTVSKTLIFATVISLFGEWFRELFLQFILRPCPVTIFG